MVAVSLKKRAGSLQEYLTYKDELTGGNTLQGYVLETGPGSSIVVIKKLSIGLLSNDNVILGDGTGYETTMPAHDRVTAKIPDLSVIDNVTAFIASLPDKQSYLVDFYSPYTNPPVGLINLITEPIFAN